MKVYKEIPPDAAPRRWPAALILALAGAGLAWYVLFRWGDDPDKLWAKAQADLREGRLHEADAAAKRIGELRDPTALDWLLRSQVSMALKRDDEALEALTHVPDADPMAPQARLLAGQVELRRGRAKKAAEALSAAVRLNPKLVQAQRELIYIYGMLLRRRDLNRTFRDLSELTPLTFDNAFHWCLTRNTVWEPKEIIPILQDWSKSDPDDNWSRLALAENLRQVGRRDEASRILEELPPGDPDARVIRARVALDRNDLDGAERLLAEGPADHPELARMRGRIALTQRDGPTALKNFRAAYESEPDHRDSVFGLGQALAMTGDEKAAAPLQQLAKDFDALGTLVQRAATPEGRNDKALRRALGAACEKIHRLPEARAWYNLALEADPLDAEAQKALFRIGAEMQGTNASDTPPNGASE